MNVHAWIQKHHWVPIMVSATHNRYHYPFVNELITAYSTNILNLLGTGMQAVMRLPISSLFQQLNISTNVLWNSCINANDSVFSPICCSLNREQTLCSLWVPWKPFHTWRLGLHALLSTDILILHLESMVPYLYWKGCLISNMNMLPLPLDWPILGFQDCILFILTFPFA